MKKFKELALHKLFKEGLLLIGWFSYLKINAVSITLAWSNLSAVNKRIECIRSLYKIEEYMNLVASGQRYWTNALKRGERGRS